MTYEEVKEKFEEFSFNKECASDGSIMIPTAVGGNIFLLKTEGESSLSISQDPLTFLIPLSRLAKISEVDGEIAICLVDNTIISVRAKSKLPDILRLF